MSVRAIADVIGALENILLPEPDSEPVELGLIDITRGSAVYRCVSSNRDQTTNRLRLVGRLIQEEESTNGVLGQVFPHLKTLSEAARLGGGELSIRRIDGKKRETLATILPDTYTQLKSAYTVSGQTTLFGELKRVGGATAPKCMIRALGQRRAIYCALTQRQARVLARQLYQKVVLEGEAVWLRGCWDIVDFLVLRIVPYRKRSLAAARELLRNAGAERWDSVPDSDIFFTSDDGDEV